MNGSVDSGATVRPRDPGIRRGLRPLWVIHGGRQADSLRRLLNEDLTAPYVAVSATSADRMTASDLPAFHRLVSHADAFISEPLPSGYRDLPIGLDDVVPYLRPGIPIVTFPRVSYSGLHPFQVEPDAVSPLPSPPLVPYHDLRTAAVASGRLTTEESEHVRPSDRTIREYAAWQLLRMRRRESLTDCSVAGSVRGAGLAAVHAVDRPGNALLVGMAAAILSALDADVAPLDPGPVLMGDCRSPVETMVADALGIGSPESGLWSVKGRPLSRREIHEAHLDWYRHHPDVLKSVIASEAPRMDLLGIL